MPNIGYNISLTLGGSGFNLLQVRPAPFKINQVKRQSEIGLIFDGSLQVDPNSGDMVPANDIPVASNIDGGNLNPPGHTYLLEKNIGVGNTYTLNDSIDMSPYNASPSQSDANKDVPTNSTIRFRHMSNTSANVLMVDGHVESFKYNPLLKMNDLKVHRLQLQEFVRQSGSSCQEISVISRREIGILKLKASFALKARISACCYSQLFL